MKVITFPTPIISLLFEIISKPSRPEAVRPVCSAAGKANMAGSRLLLGPNATLALLLILSVSELIYLFLSLCPNSTLLLFWFFYCSVWLHPFACAFHKWIVPPPIAHVSLTISSYHYKAMLVRPALALRPDTLIKGASLHWLLFKVIPNLLFKQ